MKKLLSCALALLLVLLTPASANSAPTRSDGDGGSALAVDEGCPVTVSAEQLTFDIGGEGGWNGLTAQVTAVYQMENPTDESLPVQMTFYLEQYRTYGREGAEALDTEGFSITADGEPVEFACTKAEADAEDTDRFALTYTVDFPAGAAREVAVSYPSRDLGRSDWSSHWRHTFTYLLSPARHWTDFGTLDVAVTTPESSPYVIQSSLPLEEAGGTALYRPLRQSARRGADLYALPGAAHHPGRPALLLPVSGLHDDGAAPAPPLCRASGGSGGGASGLADPPGPAEKGGVGAVPIPPVRPSPPPPGCGSTPPRRAGARGSTGRTGRCTGPPTRKASGPGRPAPWPGRA